MKTLRTKLILFVLAVSFVITVTISAVGLISVSSTANNTLTEMVSPLAVQTAESVSSKISYYMKMVENTAGNTIIRNPQSSSTLVTNQMTSQATTLKCSAYAIYDKDDKVFVSLADKIDEGITSSDFYLKAKNEKTITVSDPFIGANGTKYFIIAAPVLNISSGDVLYVLTAYYSFDKIQSVIEQVEFGNTGHGYLINKSGLTIADKITENVDKGFNAITEAQKNKKYKELAEIYQKAINGESGSKLIRLDGKTQVVGYSSVPDTDWILITVAPKNEFLTGTASTIATFAIAAVILFAAAIFITTIIVKNIVLPIIKTTERLKALSEGNLSDPVEVSRQKNEIGVLSSSLEETVFSLKQYIDKISDALNNIAEGNLSFEMTGHFRGDFVKIKTTFNSILASLRNTFENINGAADQVNTGAVQLSNGAQALSQGAAQQANSIDMLSEKLVDISDKVNSSAEAAAKTENLVDNITNEIHSCNEKMNNMLSSMDDINKSSAEISKIIKVIDDIAFQTNILALNAAVEAARAGSAGRGFAVVADEVRNLAAKSAEAAKQTTSLIENSISSVKKGTKIARDTASSLDVIVDGASQISKQIKLISSAAQEQADAVNQINDNVSEIAAVVQTNTATAEESAAASEELSSQSNILKEMLSKFKYDANFEKEEDDYGDYSTSFASTPTFDFGAPLNEDKPFDFGNAPQENKPFDFGPPLEENKPFDFGAPAQEDKPFDFGEPLQENKPFDFGTSAENKPFDFGTPAQEDKPFDFGTPAQENKPFDFGEPLQEEKPFDFGTPYDFDNAPQPTINLDDDENGFKNDDGKY